MSTPLKPTVAKRLLADRKPPPVVMPEGDQRIEIFNGAIVQFDHKDDYVREITALWRRAQSTFLQIGTYLNLAKKRLPHGDFVAMIERDLPFGATTAFQIRAAAEAVASGRLPAEDLPPSYSTLYALSTLPDTALEEAWRSGLKRPDLKRVEVLDFKRKLRIEIDGDSDSHDMRIRRLDALRRQRVAIDQEIAALEAQEAAAEAGRTGT
jgi:hypothetical protein